MMQPQKIVFIFAFIIVFLVLFAYGESDTNLIYNGGFEEPALDGWFTDAYEQGSIMMATDRKVHSGKTAAVISNTDVSNDARILQTVKVKPNTSYRISGWIATENVQTENAREDKDIIGGNICVMGGWDYAGNIKGTQDWQKVEFSYTTKPDESTVQLGPRLGMYFADIKGTAYFDDIMMVETGSASQSQVVPGSSAGSSGGQLVSVVIWVLIIGAIFLLVVIVMTGNKKKKEQKKDEGSGAAE